MNLIIIINCADEKKDKIYFQLKAYLCGNPIIKGLEGKLVSIWKYQEVVV